MHVLLIEPDHLLARSYQAALTRAGHRVYLAATAQGAIHQADQQKPDVVVLEMELPGHNGVEFLYEFRSYYEWLDIPVIIHSFMPPADMANNTVLKNELGVVGVLYKPSTSLAQLCAGILRLVAPKVQSL